MCLLPSLLKKQEGPMLVRPMQLVFMQLDPMLKVLMLRELILLEPKPLLKMTT